MGELTSLYVFGSFGRGDEDSISDLDLLAIVKDGRGKVDEAEILGMIPQNLHGPKPSISWYGENRLRQMFHNGELFAWHLHKETRIVCGERFLDELGIPSNYTDAVKDIHSFKSVMSGIPGQIASDHWNAIYELGLIYVCLRNIAMSASWNLCASPDFSRYSPFKLRGVLQCPLRVEDYELAMSCRMSGQRGLIPPKAANASLALGMYNALDGWIESILARIESGRHE